MKQCEYAAQVIVRNSPHTADKVQIVYCQCERKNVLGSSGWHLHDAGLPGALGRAHPGVRVRWRSTNTPDYAQSRRVA